MPAPQNYMLNLPDPTNALLSGYGTGLKIQQARQQAEQQAQQQQVMANLYENPNPTAEDFKKAVFLLPKQQSDAALKMWESLNEDQKQSNLKFGADVMSSIKYGDPEIAKDMLKERAAAERNSGNEQKANLYESFSRQVDENPDDVFKAVGIGVARMPGGDKIIDSINKIGETGFKAQKIDIEKQKLGLRKDENKLRAMEAGLKKETNELKKQELKQKIEQKKQEIEQKKQEQIGEAEASVATFDKTLDTINRIMEDPNLEKSTGLGSLLGNIPGTAQKDFASLVDVLNSQTFLSEIQKMKGLGALSENEGKKLSSAVANLDVAQSAKAFKENLKTAKELMQKARERAAKKLPEGSATKVRNQEEQTPDIQSLIDKYTK